MLARKGYSEGLALTVVRDALAQERAAGEAEDDGAEPWLWD
jgi:regulatory protein